MKEIYWITRLDAVNDFLIILIILTVIAIVATSALKVFVPTTNEMYTIIGIGGTYEYLKDNKDIKEIPDNTIKALKIWSENLVSEEEAKKKK